LISKTAGVNTLKCLKEHLCSSMPRSSLDKRSFGMIGRQVVQRVICAAQANCRWLEDTYE
jgi:hypothetical protein